MLNLFAEQTSDCERTRRNFMLQVGSLGGLGLSLEMLLRAEARAAVEDKSKARDVNCILIWTRGGGGGGSKGNGENCLIQHNTFVGGLRVSVGSNIGEGSEYAGTIFYQIEMRRDRVFGEA